MCAEKSDSKIEILAKMPTLRVPKEEHGLVANGAM
jgi:hypothetical protein